MCMSIVYKSLREFYQSFICYINLIRSPSLCESQDFVLTRNGLILVCCKTSALLVTV